jgi:hypothetical protein
MDCLTNYCLQMDFVTHRMRFLDPNGLDARDPQLGQAFPLIYSNGRMCIQADLFGGEKMKSRLDTGDPNDFILAPALFEKACRDQKDAKVDHFKTPRGRTVGIATFPHGIFAIESCTDLIIGENPETNSPENTIGMRFLARHLVTLNIPKGVLYLKQESEGPLK